MACFLSVANRKGGVGKSTTAVMLAHAFAAWGGLRVLVMDLDSQCNASLILMGGEAWSRARRDGLTISDYFFDLFDETHPKPRDFLVHNAGDVRLASGKPLPLSVLPGSLMLEDVQGELYVKEARQSKDPEVVGQRVRGRLERLLRRFEPSYDLVIIDCPPGLSFAALAALKIADRVIVPFRPDYVSQLAVDRIALLIEERRNEADLAEIPLSERRYACLANSVRPTGKDRLLIEEIGLLHPMIEAQIPHSDAIANAFDWEAQRRTIEDKYGAGAEPLRVLYDEIAQYLSLRRAA